MTDDLRPRPLLRARLDRELAHLDLTPEAGRRLQEAISGGRAGRSRRPSRPWRGWSAPLTVAAMVAAVVAIAATAAEVPIAAIRQLGLGGPAPRQTITAGATSIPEQGLHLEVSRRATAGGEALEITLVWPPGTASSAPPIAPSPLPTGTSTGTLRPSGAVPTPTASTGAPRPSGGVAIPSASASASARARALLEASTNRIAGGDASARAAATGIAGSRAATTAAGTPSATGGAPPGVAVALLDWGDGQQARQQVRCLGGGVPAGTRVSFRHTYRAAGQYRITATVMASNGCGGSSQTVGAIAGVSAR